MTIYTHTVQCAAIVKLLTHMGSVYAFFLTVVTQKVPDMLFGFHQVILQNFPPFACTCEFVGCWVVVVVPCMGDAQGI